MLLGGLGQKGIDVVHLFRRSRGIADYAAADAGLGKLFRQAVCARDGISGFVVKFSDGMSRLFRQLIREYVYMDICCLHKNFPSQSRK